VPVPVPLGAAARWLLSLPGDGVDDTTPAPGMAWIHAFCDLSAEAGKAALPTLYTRSERVCGCGCGCECGCAWIGGCGRQVELMWLGGGAAAAAWVREEEADDATQIIVGPSALPPSAPTARMGTDVHLALPGLSAHTGRPQRHLPCRAACQG
jgi:hypothetical protein